MRPRAGATTAVFVRAGDLISFHPDRPAWAQPLDLDFRRKPDGWTRAGLERNP